MIGYIPRHAGFSGNWGGTDPAEDERLLRIQAAKQMSLEYAPFWYPRTWINYFDLSDDAKRELDSEIDHWLAECQQVGGTSQ